MWADQAKPGKAVLNVRHSWGKQPSARLQQALELLQTNQALPNAMQRHHVGWWGRCWGQKQLVCVKKESTFSTPQPHRPAGLLGQKVPVPEPGGLPCPHTFPCTQELWAFKKILSLWRDYFISGLPWKLGREREHGYAEFISPGPNIVSSLRYSWPGTKCCSRGCGLHGLPAAAPYHAFPWCLWLTGVHWEGALDTPLRDTEPRERHLCKERPEMLLIHSKCRKMHLNVSSAFQMCLSLKIWKLTVLSKEHWRNWRAHIGKNSIIFLHCTGMQCWELNSTLRHA